MSFTVKVAQNAGIITTGAGILVEVLTQTRPLAAQPAASASNQNTSTGYSKAFTTTVTGSLVYGGIGGSTASLTPTAATTIISQAAQNSFQIGACKTTSVTGTPGSVTVGASNTYSNIGVGLYEVLPDGVITTDPSTPALATANASSATTAAFTPPPGALLVACVVAASQSVTITDTSGLGLTWTLKNTAVPGDGFAGVYLSQMPGIVAAPFTPPIQAIRRSSVW